MESLISTATRKFCSLLAYCTAVSVATLVLLFLAEGASSFGLSLFSSPPETTLPRTEKIYTQYDPQLGWKTIPKFFGENFFGRGRNLTINAQGLRALKEFPAESEGGIRILCSGDSFTFGEDLGDLETWCHLLADLSPVSGSPIDTINAGQPGYGIDQALLRYRLVAPKFAHQKHIFAFILDDLERMRTRKFVGRWPKPMLRLSGSGLEAINVPVPAMDGMVPIFGQIQVHGHMRVALNQLRLVQLFRTLHPPAQPSESSAPLSDAAVGALLSAVFAELKTYKPGFEELLVVILPTGSDYATAASDRWRLKINDILQELGIAGLDLIHAMRLLPAEDAGKLFTGALRGGHNTSEGGRWTAEKIRSRLNLAPG